MKPFLPIACPEVLPFDMFTDLVEAAETPTEELLQCTKEAIAEAKSNLQAVARISPNISRTQLCEADFKAEARAMLKSCFGMGVAVGVIEREFEAGSAEDCKIVWEDAKSKGWHASFPVPEVVAARK